MKIKEDSSKRQDKESVTGTDLVLEGDFYLFAYVLKQMAF